MPTCPRLLAVGCVKSALQSGLLAPHSRLGAFASHGLKGVEECCAPRSLPQPCAVFETELESVGELRCVLLTLSWPCPSTQITTRAALGTAAWMPSNQLPALTCHIIADIVAKLAFIGAMLTTTQIRFLVPSCSALCFVEGSDDVLHLAPLSPKLL